jgi:DNA-binding MarR family transcriptional regulator
MTIVHYPFLWYFTKVKQMNRADKSVEPPRDFGILLALAYAAFVEDLREAVADAGYHDLHRSFGYVARMLAEAPLTLRQVADRLEVTSPAALKVVVSMMKSGYLERLDDPEDRRARKVRLTKKGFAALARARAFHRQFERSLTREVGARTARKVRAALEGMIALREGRGGTVTLRPM